MTRDTSENRRYSDPTAPGGDKYCACGCKLELPFTVNRKTKEKVYRKNRIYASRLCKDRMRNHQRYERQKQATALAIQILENQGYQVQKGGK